MANVIIGKVEVVGEDVLAWVKKAETGVTIKGPAAIIALANLLNAVLKAGTAINADVSDPLSLLNVSADVQTYKDIMAVLPDIKVVFTDLGINFPS